MDEAEFAPIQDSYFPDFDQIDLDVDSLITGLQGEI